MENNTINIGHIGHIHGSVGKDMKLLIVDGDDYIGNTIGRHLYTHDIIPEVIVHTDILSNTFSLNGLVYTEKNDYISDLSSLIKRSTTDYNRTLSDNIDIKKEYGLIQLKKSNLSKWERQEVIKAFERRYQQL